MKHSLFVHYLYVSVVSMLICMHMDAAVGHLCMLFFSYPDAVLFLSDLFSVCVCLYRTLQSTEPGGHFICTVYLEEKKDTAEQHVKVTWT